MKKIIISAAFVLAIAGCATSESGSSSTSSSKPSSPAVASNGFKSYDVVSSVSGGRSAATVKQTIIRTGKARRWIIKETGSNTLMATQLVSNLRADVEITYSGSSYSFRLVSSSGLRQTPTRVHPRYTNWIKTWDGDIQRTLLTRGY